MMGRFAEIGQRLKEKEQYILKGFRFRNTVDIAWLIARLIKAEAQLLKMNFIHSHNCARNSISGCGDVRHSWNNNDWEAEAEKKLTNEEE
jgi:hypothetical protein